MCKDKSQSLGEFQLQSNTIRFVGRRLGWKQKSNEETITRQQWPKQVWWQWEGSLCVATGSCRTRSKRTKTGCVDEKGEGVTQDTQASSSGASMGQCHSWGQTGTRGRGGIWKAQREDYGKDIDRLTSTPKRQIPTGK